MEDIEHLEVRVGKLEDSMKSLASLPDKFDMLIELTKQSNADSKELAKHFNENYANKELCVERHKTINASIQEDKDFRKWVYASLIIGAFTVIMELAKVVTK